jgi:hypothetical protein
MSVITKGIDKSARVGGRSASFVSGVDFNVNDIIDVEYSLGGGSSGRVTVEAGAGASCTFRINSLNRRYPLLSTAKSLNYPAPDLQNEATWINSDAPTYSLTAGQIKEFDNIAIANLEFTAVVDTVTVTIIG